MDKDTDIQVMFNVIRLQQDKIKELELDKEALIAVIKKVSATPTAESIIKYVNDAVGEDKYND